jgi:hypothetical protein
LASDRAAGRVTGALICAGACAAEITIPRIAAEIRNDVVGTM